MHIYRLSAAHPERERDRHRRREANHTLTATPKPFLQHSTDNQKILAAGVGVGVVLKANSLTLDIHPSNPAPQPPRTAL